MTEINSGAGSSPFEGSMPTRSRRALHAAASATVVVIAILAAFVLTRGESDATTTAAHGHGTPGAGNSAPVTLDAQGARRIGVTFAAVTIEPMTTDVRSLGQVTYDETRSTAIAPKVDGWVEKLHVNFTGQDVREGEALLDIYSPMLVTAQEELLLAARLVRDVANGTDEARRAAEEMLASARRRLQYWDIPAADIERIERTGQATRTVTLRAASRGVVVEKFVLSGQRIMAGETLYRLADLRTVWVDGQVFEHDLALVRRGQRVSVEIQAYPGDRWPGSVTYVYPLVDPATRTARIRVELSNSGLRLKPGMFATVHLTSALRSRVLSVPRSAVLSTGQRSIVFLKSVKGTLEPIEVVTGAANDDRVEIRNGLRSGDTVVASATFLIDAESNLKSALGNMAGMPGMDAPTSRAVPANRDSSGMKPTPKKIPPVEDHSKHGMADTVTARQGSVLREE
jgi:Cu(I)/Ag(I) efflux system membrane fusion protein